MATLDDLSLDQLQALYAQKTDPNVGAIHSIESGGAAATASPVNPASGARSSMQTMPATAAQPGFGVKPSNGTPVDDTRTGVQYYQSMLQRYNDPVKAAVAYDWGPGNADKWIASGGHLDDLPLETLQYIQKFDRKTGALTKAPEPAQQAATPQQAPVEGDTSPAGFKPLGSVLTGIGDFAKGATRAIVHGGASLANTIAPNSQFTKDINAAVPQIDATMQGQDQAYAAQRAAEGKTGTDWGRMAGSILPALAIPAGAETIPGRIAMGAATGGIQGAAMTQPGQSYGKNAATGAAYGGAGAALTALAGKLISGATPNKYAQAMIDRGVTPTPGQLMGGAVNNVEEKAASFPFAGEAVATGRQAGVKQMNQALYREVLAPVGEQAPKDVSRESVEEIGNKLSSRYQKVLPQMQFAPDQQFMQDLHGIAQDVSSLPEDIRNRFTAILDRNFLNQMHNGQLDGEGLKQVESALGQHARTVSTDTFQMDMANAVGDVQKALRDALMRQNPAQAPELQNINRAYANYSILREAASHVTDPTKAIQPGQLQAAVRKADVTVGKGNFAKANARLQEFSDASVATLGSRVPDSGTGGRLGLIGLLGGTAFISPQSALTGAAMSAMYGTEAGRKLMLAALARRPDAVRAFGATVQRLAPQAGAAAGALSGRSQ